MSYNNKKFLDANGVTQIVGLLDDYATNEALTAVVNSVDNAISAKYTKPSGGIPPTDLASGVIPNIPVTDVQVNGSTILNNGVANIPKAGDSTLGVVKGRYYGVRINADGDMYISTASESEIKAGSSNYLPIVPSNQHKSAFYALAKLAGADMTSSSNAVGTYTDAAKQGIQKLFGFEDILGNYESSTTASKAYTVGETFIFDGKRYRVTADIAQNYVITPGTNCELDPIDGRYIKDTDYATSNKAGVIKVSADTYGVRLINGTLATRSANESEMKSGTNTYKVIVPSAQHTSIFYGLSKLAGVDLASSDTPVGTYTNAAKGAIQKMLGIYDLLSTEELTTATATHATNSLFLLSGKLYKATSDIEIGEAVVEGTNCANVKADEVFVKNTDYATDQKAGIAKVSNAFGIQMTNNSEVLAVQMAGLNEIKSASNYYKPIVPASIHQATFYGLAKAAGDTTQASSSNAIGTYTEAAKTAIRSMLGIDGSAAIVEEVTGTAPTITGMPNVRYVCGEVSLLTITPPACGSIEVIFTSGSTAPTLTVPNTVKWPAWFEAEELDSNMIYDIIITDAAYGAVMAWAN